MFNRTLSFMRSVYRNRNDQIDLPRFLTYTVTFGCNAKCIMCDSWKMPAKGDLTLDEVDRIFAQLPVMDAIRLTGGEPFVRDHRVPLQMLVSIDGVEEKHNHVRGSTQAWNMVMETIRALAPQQKKLGLRLGVNQTIVDAEGAEHYRKLREVLKPYGVHNNVVLAYDMSATYNMEKEVDVAPTEIGQFTTFGEFTDQNLRDLLDEVEQDTKSLPFGERLAKRYYLRGIRNRLLEKRGTPNPKCVALTAHLRIFPNGDVPTCQFNSRVVGNLRQSSFKEIWNSIAATEQRGWVKRCPGCWAECEVLPSAIYTLDLLKPSFAKGPTRPKTAK